MLRLRGSTPWLGLLFFVVGLGSVLAASGVLAAEQVIFGPAQYTRTSGAPNDFTETFVLPPTLTGPFRLHVQNGTPEGLNRLSSASLWVNASEAAGPADFNQEVGSFDRAVSLQATNVLQVPLASPPGAVLTVTLYASVPPPTLTALEPPSLAITTGGAGTVTATISAAQSTPTTIDVESLAPAVASVVSTVVVPVGALSAPITVTGVATGTATIRATLNGRSLESAVRVSPAGPTLTSLTPATLQVTQGASGALAVTLSAVQSSETPVALRSSAPTVLGLPGEVIVPAGVLQQTFAVFGVSAGAATVTAALNGSSAESRLTVVVPAPTVISLLPPRLPLTEGSSRPV
jgi:hypothetical protein